MGVVGSGDLEIIMEPSDSLTAVITIRTGVLGYRELWDAVIHRFFTQNDYAVSVKINDFGATPGMVTIRLAQALEVSCYD